MHEKQQAIEQDIELEKKNRFESIQHIKQCLQSDFPKLQQQIDKEQEDAQLNMDKLKLYANQKTQKLNSAIDDQKKIREESEEQMVQLLKEMMAKIKD